MLLSIEQFGKFLSSLFKNTDHQLVSRVACSYLQQVIQALIHFLVVIRDAKMLKNLVPLE